MNPIKIHTASFRILTSLIISAFIFVLSSSVFHVHNVDLKTHGVSLEKPTNVEVEINRANSNICFLIHYFTTNYNLDLIEISNESFIESTIAINQSNSISFQSSFHNKIKLRGPPKAV